VRACVCTTRLQTLLPCRQLHSIISEDESFTAAVLDLVLAMQLAAAGPLWKQGQQEGASQAERCVHTSIPNAAAMLG
jgi:hypothetical protein